MARIRTIKPVFFTNEDLAELSYADRLLFIGLWTQADKAGRLEDRPKRLKAYLFPYDDFEIDDGLGRLANANFITRYEGNDGRPLIQVCTWSKHQRPPRSEPESDFEAPLQKTFPDELNRLEGKGKERGKEGNGSPALSRERFERVWSEYPRKVGKDAAWKEWLKRSPDDDLSDVMISKIREQRASAQWLKDGGQFIPHLRTWLHQGRWQDEESRTPLLKQQTVNNAKAIDEWLNRPLHPTE